ncbi:MAG TPA: 16S rRNA (uracil(1498)-N(3))-methyltransferase [Myxococcales bacterium]|nr:16S rRNA (uracil(1498)-N(3))-methyltransferase [Myxococcales bacterium]
MVRLLLPAAGEAAGEVAVTGPRLHYLRSVLRLREGDALEVFDGRGGARDAKVARLGAEEARLSLGPRREAPARRRISVVQGLPKAEKMEWVIQKGTELGAAAFAPAPAARSVVKLDERRAAERTRRWRAIAEEAARQSGRADVPEVHPPRPLVDAVRALGPARVLVLDEEERSALLGDAHALAGPGEALALVVGPEGGLTREEVSALVEAHRAVPVTLGTLVLRTETAALAALAVLRHLDGELG